jgi:hypothetical protein
VRATPKWAFYTSKVQYDYIIKIQVTTDTRQMEKQWSKMVQNSQKLRS